MLWVAICFAWHAGVLTLGGTLWLRTGQLMKKLRGGSEGVERDWSKSNAWPQSSAGKWVANCDLLIKLKVGRGERIRTSDSCVPNAVLYQAELHPEADGGSSMG